VGDAADDAIRRAEEEQETEAMAEAEDRHERLAVLERRADDIEVFVECERVAREWLRSHSSDELVEDLRRRRTDRRRMSMGTTNTLILLNHIDRLEEAVGGYKVGPER